MESIRDTYVKIPSSKIRQGGVGTFLGVFLPTILTMMGVCLYLRLGFIIGSSGFIVVGSAFLLGLVITFITALSISSTASNMKIKEGGTYFMISRSFGLEVGASTGIALYIAHTMMLSLCILGFSDSISQFFPYYISVQSVSVITLMCLTILAYTSTDFALKMQMGVIVLVVLALVFLVTGEYSPDKVITAKGHYTVPSFWMILSMIYPGLTGIEAGAAMSGDLKNPTRSIAIGTILASLIGFLFYIGVSALLWNKVPQDYLIYDPNVIENILGNHPLALSGFWAASLASALGCLLSAPRTFRAMALDGLFPKWIAYPLGDLQIPKVATLITSGLAFLCIYFGTVQEVVLLLTMVLLIIYGLLNFATAIEAIVGNPSWRPTFRMSPYVSLLGSGLCLVAMLMMGAGQTFIALLMIVMIYTAVKRRGPRSKWDDLRQTMLFSLARFAIYRLAYAKQSPRSWRPNFLVLSESGGMKSPLIYWASQMTQGHGFLTLASVLRTGSTEYDDIDRWEKLIFDNLKKRKIEALVEMTVAENLKEGLEKVIASYGVGSLTPNTVVLGECVRKEYFTSYLELVSVAVSSRRNVLVVRGDLETVEEQEIDIWWDDRAKDNSEMMILLSLLLLQSKGWRKAKIILKSVVYTEKALELRGVYFEQFCKESRLRMTSKVYLASSEESTRSLISEMSTKNGVVFLSLLSPEEEEHYAEYYSGLMDDLKEIKTACFVICKQNIDIHAILS